jgi:hypothetical protein
MLFVCTQRLSWKMDFWQDRDGLHIPYRRFIMEYAPEAITQLAQQVTQVFKAALEQRLAASPSVVTIAEIEKEMRELLRQTGAQALSQFLSLGAGTLVAELPCACGGTLHYPRQREATVTSVFGRITYTRAYYAGCACGEGHAPVNEQYGLVPGAVTAGLAALLGLGGSSCRLAKVGTG